MYFETALSNSYYSETEKLLYIKLKKDPEPTLQLTIQNYEETYAVLGERTVKVIIDTRHVDFLKFPRPVMDYMAKNPYIKYQVSTALLINGTGQMILGNFYLKVAKPAVYTKIFTNLEKAVDWQQINNKELLLESLNGMERVMQPER